MRGTPRALDLCCGVGGASQGLINAGFSVTGVDIAPQPDYPFHFIQGDALEFCEKYGRDYDFIWAGFPCQAGNPLTTGTNASTRLGSYPELIEPGREALLRTGRPFVMETTAGNRIRKDVKLVGDMFTGLQVWRPRYFEVHGFDVPQPPMPKKRGRTRGWRHGIYYDGPYLAVYGQGGGKATVPEAKLAMGIDWTDSLKSLAEAIPPAYSQYLAEFAMSWLYGRWAQ